MRQFNVTELDFEEIKKNIKNYFINKEGGEYADWDFEGSGLNHLLDILAYNTHYNAILAHSSINESFLDSAQVRSNVVSRAKLLGYNPKSITAATAQISLVFTSGTTEDNIYNLPSGTEFTTSIDGETFTFITRETYEVQRGNDNNFTFSDINLYQGRKIIRRFDVDASQEKQVYALSDQTADISTLIVKVYDNQNISETNINIFSKFTTFSEINEESQVYFPFENFNGNYVVEFGNGVIGKALEPLNVVEFEYISTDGPAANRASSFTWAGTGEAPISVTTTSVASGGANRESIESIRFNAPLSFISQNRAVTAEDYRALLLRDFPSIQSISVWGGQDNDPPQHGKVFISIKETGTEDGIPLTEEFKERIKNSLEKEKVIAILPEVVDPEYTYLYLDVLFKYNSNLTNSTKGQLQNSIRELIKNYSDEQLERYNNVFRASNLLTIIDQSSVAILNTVIRVYLYKVLELTSQTNVSQSVNFKQPLDADVNLNKPLISSDPWTSPDGETIYLADEKIEGETDKRNLYTFKKIGNNDVVVHNSIGTMNISDGSLSFTSIPVNSVDDGALIKIYAKPASNDVAVKQNNIISIDSNITSILGEVDTIEVSGSSGASNYRTFER
jgi:hypothetical protein